MSILRFGVLVLVCAFISGVHARAAACGACVVVPPTTPGKEPGAVTAHRMAITVRGNETILWDQIVYAGAPEDFVWLLPVAEGIEVELAENAFFEALVSQSRLRLDGPSVCLPNPSDVATVSTPTTYEAGPIARAMELPLDVSERDVAVSHEAVVGPYETVTLRGASTDVVSWLVERGYLVPETLVPIIDDYARRGMSFAVLRLAPGLGVDRMQPVRVRLPGVSPSLPLRMVSAGVVTTVDLELFVIGEGRYEVSGFGNAEVERDRLAYDVAIRNFNYQELFDAALFAGSGVGTNWVTEYAAPLDVGTARAFVSRVDGEPTPRSAAVDVDVAVRDLDQPYLTRLRTRLPPSELGDDLSVRVSLGGDLTGPVSVARVLNEDPTPCTPRDGGMGSDAGPRGPRDEGPRVICIADCRAGSRSTPSALGAIALLGVLAWRRSRR